MGEAQEVEVASVEAELRGVRLPFGLELELVRITGANLQIGTDPPSFTLPSPGDLEVSVTDLALQSFLEKKAPGGLRDFFVQLTEGKVHVHATARVLIELRAAAICSLRIVEGKQLFVDLEKVDVAGVGARGLVQKHIEVVNPIFDADDLPVDATLETITVSAGRVIVRGKIAPKRSGTEL